MRTYRKAWAPVEDGDIWQQLSGKKSYKRCKVSNFSLLALSGRDGVPEFSVPLDAEKMKICVI